MTERNDGQYDRTRIYVTQSPLSSYPHCIIPRHVSHSGALLIDQVRKHQDERIRKLRSVLSIATWDGRSIMEVNCD